MSSLCITASSVSHTEASTSSSNLETDLEELLNQIHSGRASERKTALESLQKILEEKEGFVERLIANKGLPILLDCLDLHHDPTAQSTALVIFSIITSGSSRQNQAVVNSGAVLPFIHLVDSPTIDVAEQALICVGNIACEDAFNRKVVYENGGLAAILLYLRREDLDEEQLNSGVWAFSNMCRSRTLISLNILKSCVACIKQLLKKEDPEVLRSACAAAAYLTDGPSDRVQMFLDGSVCRPIIKLIYHPDPLVVFSALRAVSNFLSGSDRQIEEMIALDVVSCLAHVLKRHKERRMLKEACMALSNIAAGSQSEILKIVEVDLVEDLIHSARHAPLDVRTEATWALGNAIVGCGHALIKEFLTPDCMKVLSAGLLSKNVTLVRLSLQAIRNFLWCGDFGEDPHFNVATWDSEHDEDFWEHAEWLSKSHGFFRLAKLREHQDPEISRYALQMLDALVQDPQAAYSDEDIDRSSESDDEESDYDDLLNTIQSTSLHTRN